MSKSSLIVCGVFAAVSLLAAPAFAESASVDSGARTVAAGSINWLNGGSDAEALDLTITPATANAARVVPSPGSALLLVAAAFFVGGGRRRPTGLAPRQESRKLTVVANHATRAEECLVRFGTGVLARPGNRMVAQA